MCVRVSVFQGVARIVKYIGNQPCSIQDKVYNDGSINYDGIKKSSMCLLFISCIFFLPLVPSHLVIIGKSTCCNKSKAKEKQRKKRRVETRNGKGALWKNIKPFTVYTDKNNVNCFKLTTLLTWKNLDFLECVHEFTFWCVRQITTDFMWRPQPPNIPRAGMSNREHKSNVFKKRKWYKLGNRLRRRSRFICIETTFVVHNEAWQME